MNRFNALRLARVPQAAAVKLVKNHPELVDQWLAGVTTFDGGAGAAAVKAHLGM